MGGEGREKKRKPRIKQRMDGRSRGRRGDAYRGRKVGARRGTSRLEKDKMKVEREGGSQGERKVKRERN